MRRIAGLVAAVRVDAGLTYYLGLAVVVVVLGVALIAFYRVWTEVQEDEEPDSPEDLFESFREAHAAGQIDDRELERLSRLLSDAGGRTFGSAKRHPRARDPISDQAADFPDDVQETTGADETWHRTS